MALYFYEKGHKMAQSMNFLLDLKIVHFWDFKDCVIENCEGGWER